MGPRIALPLFLVALVAVLSIVAPIVAVFALGAVAGAVAALLGVWHVLPLAVRPWVRAAVVERLSR